MTSNDSGYPQKWQDRFAFFDAYGAPNTPTFKAALKALPTTGEKMKININWLALLFAPLYFLVVGLWRKALVGFAVYVGTIIALMFLPGALAMLGRGVDIAIHLLFGLSANYAYYLKQVKGKDDWNFFEGMRW